MRNKILFITVVLLLGVGLHLVYNSRSLITPKVQKLTEIPKHFGSWHIARDTIFDENTLRILRPTDYLMRTYANSSGVPISLYVGYHDGSPSAGPIHSPKNCLPGGGWEFTSIEDITMKHMDSNIKIVRAVLEKDGEDMAFYYWYQVRGEVITDDLDMKVAEFLGMLTSNRKDAAFIRLGIDLDNKELEKKTMQDFFESAYPLLKNHLPS